MQVSIPPRPCEFCGEVFTTANRTNKDTKKFCSKSCATRATHKAERARDVTRSGMLGYCKPGLEATESPTLMQIAWAAGLYEGEGCCTRMGKGSQQVILGQKDPWVCDRMKTLFGGSIHERTMNGEPFYDWHIHGARARGFLMTMFSFLSPRRQEQVQACL